MFNAAPFGCNTIVILNSQANAIPPFVRLTTDATETERSQLRGAISARQKMKRSFAVDDDDPLGRDLEEKRSRDNGDFCMRNRATKESFKF